MTARTMVPGQQQRPMSSDVAANSNGGDRQPGKLRRPGPDTAPVQVTRPVAVIAGRAHAATPSTDPAVDGEARAARHRAVEGKGPLGSRTRITAPCRTQGPRARHHAPQPATAPQRTQGPWARDHAPQPFIALHSPTADARSRTRATALHGPVEDLGPWGSPHASRLDVVPPTVAWAVRVSTSRSATVLGSVASRCRASLAGRSLTAEIGAYLASTSASTAVCRIRRSGRKDLQP